MLSVQYYIREKIPDWMKALAFDATTVAAKMGGLVAASFIISVIEVPISFWIFKDKDIAFTSVALKGGIVGGTKDIGAAWVPTYTIGYIVSSAGILGSVRDASGRGF